MKTPIAVGLAIFAAAALLLGCKTTGIERSADARQTMQTVENIIMQASAQIDATTASLNALFSPEQGDVRKAFGQYADDVEEMDELGKELLKQVNAMAEQRAEYFSEWREQTSTFTNPQISAASEQRQNELQAAFNRISDAGVGVRSALQTYLASVGDIRTFLSNDLTPLGLQAMTGAADKAVRDGATLKSAIHPVLVAVAETRSKLTPGAVPGTP